MNIQIKLSIVSFGALLFFPLSGASQEAPAEAGERKLTSEIGILPTSRKGVKVDPVERNPYAARVAEQKVATDLKSEASQIMQILEGLKVRGFSRDFNGNVRTVLYGDLRFSEGSSVPQLLPNQNDKLYVSRVTNEEVELAWLSEAGNKVEDGRKILIAINMEPLVQIVLPGQSALGKSGERKRAWIDVNAGNEDVESTLAAKP